jgi:DNA-directed RNA polymerase specialized sigma24 family protein/predicted metalloenzyme YecM
MLAHRPDMTDMALADATATVTAVGLAAAGDEPAFARLVAMHHASMARVAVAITGDASLAADVVQVAWETAWRRGRHAPGPRQVRAWLVAIAANEARQTLRRARGRMLVDISTLLDAEAGGDPRDESRPWTSPARCAASFGRWRRPSRCYEGSEASARTWSARHAALYDGGREEGEMADPVTDIIGDYRAFAAQQRDRLLARGIDITPYQLSHLAFRVPEWDQYVHVRTLLERHASANSENVWNGRPISLILPAEPLEVLDGKRVPMIELIPPVHQRVYRMGLEHLGVVIGDGFDAFVEAYKPVLTGQQFQGPNSRPDPVYILFEDFTHVKFYRLSLQASVELDGDRAIEGFHHVDDWVPQRLVTATGPNPLPR